jgi:hypothetical protein
VQENELRLMALSAVFHSFLELHRSVFLEICSSTCVAYECGSINLWEIAGRDLRHTESNECVVAMATTAEIVLFNNCEIPA